MTWSVETIDAALVVASAKRAKAEQACDVAQVEFHQGWIDRLLDARPHHVLMEACGRNPDGTLAT